VRSFPDVAHVKVLRLPSAAVAIDPSPDLPLTPLGRESRPLREWLTMFHLVLVALDPFEEQSAWLVDTAGRILENYDQADCRVAFLVAGTEDEARQFLGHWATDVLTIADPDLVAVKGLGLNTLPAWVHLAIDGTVMSSCEGWDPPCWREAAENLAEVVLWSAPVIPLPTDPAPFPGAPVQASA
jgi:hypothetical protein